MKEAGDDRHGPVAGGFGLRLDIEFFIDVLFQADRDAPPVDHAATAFDGFGRIALEDIGGCRARADRIDGDPF